MKVSRRVLGLLALVVACGRVQLDEYVLRYDDGTCYGGGGVYG